MTLQRRFIEGSTSSELFTTSASGSNCTYLVATWKKWHCSPRWITFLSQRDRSPLMQRGIHPLIMTNCKYLSACKLTTYCNDVVSNCKSLIGLISMQLRQLIICNPEQHVETDVPETRKRVIPKHRAANLYPIANFEGDSSQFWMTRALFTVWPRPLHLFHSKMRNVDRCIETLNRFCRV